MTGPVSLSSRLSFEGYRMASQVARALPSAAVPVVSGMAGAAMTLLAPGRRAMVARHQQRVHGHSLGPIGRQRQVRRAFDSYARYWIDSFRVPDLTPEEIAGGMTAEGLEHLDAATAAGYGAILALPHLGAWDFGGAWLSGNGYPLSVVVEPVDPPELFEWFMEYRRQLGMEVIPLGPRAGRAVLRVLRSNGRVALLCDRDIGGGGVEVEFFGEHTTLPAGPATLALRTGAALLPTFVAYDGPRRRGVIRPPLDTSRSGSMADDVARVTQDLAGELEAMIRQAPEQWHVLQPNWPSDRPGASAN